jgi:hypothetical protein
VVNLTSAAASSDAENLALAVASSDAENLALADEPAAYYSAGFVVGEDTDSVHLF